MNNKCPFPGAHLEKILTDFLNEGRRRKYYLAGSGGRAPPRNVLFFNSLSPLSWVFESFRQEIAQV